MNNSSRVYANSANIALLKLINIVPNKILDIGCGAGGNAILLNEVFANAIVFGITHSEEEASLARSHMSECWIFDLESDFTDKLNGRTFDLLIFSHVLEHLRDPSLVLHTFSKFLRKGGQVLIAVPNVLSWRMRFQFLLGRFEYSAGGVLDDTHLRFFTYETTDKLLLSATTNLKLETKSVTGSVPLWWLRRYLFPQSWSNRIDLWGCKHWPNLFGDQILISAVKL